jgi:hypothetical protein
MHACTVQRTVGAQQALRVASVANTLHLLVHNLYTTYAGTLATFYTIGGPYLVLNSLMGLGVIPLDTRVHVLMMAMAFVIITDVNVVSRHAWTDLNQHKHIKLSKRFSAGVRTAADTVSQHIDAYAAKWQTSTEIMKSPALNAAFTAHVERYVHSVT